MSGAGKRHNLSDDARKKSLETRQANREDKKRLFVAVLVEHEGNLFRACRECDVSRRQYYAWRDEDPEFKAATDEAWESALDEMESLLMDIGRGSRKGNVAAVCAVLNARGKKRGYGINRQEVSGEGGGPITLKVVFDDPKPQKEGHAA